MTVYLSFRLLTGPTSQAQGKKGPGAKVESLLVVHLPSTLAQHPPNPHPTLVQVFLPSYLFCFPSMDVYPTVTPSLLQAQRRPLLVKSVYMWTWPTFPLELLHQQSTWTSSSVFAPPATSSVETVQRGRS